MREIKSQAIEIFEVEKQGEVVPKKKYNKKTKEEVVPKEQLTNEEIKDMLGEVYVGMGNLLRNYVDLKEEYYVLIPLWIIGTYFHDKFETFPYLYFNAMRGSGKTRTLKLTCKLSNEGKVMASPTEAVLFRTTGTLGIDEFEGVASKDKTSVRELLNACYKKGTKIFRMRKTKSIEGENQTVEEFEPYRPIIMANIWGMEEVLEDRCISLILQKSNDPLKTKLIEDFDDNSEIINYTKSLVRCSQCSLVLQKNITKKWNNYIINRYTQLYTTTQTTQNNTTQHHKKPVEETSPELLEFFKIIDESGIHGRNFELFMPLFMIAMNIDKMLLDKVIKIASEIILDKQKEEHIESKDVMVIDFISKKDAELKYLPVRDLLRDFKQFSDDGDEDIDIRWFGRALKRLDLLLEKRRLGSGVEVMLNVARAKEKIKMFREESSE